MFWTIFFEGKSIFWIEYPYCTVLIHYDEIREKILTLIIAIFVDEGKELF